MTSLHLKTNLKQLNRTRYSFSLMHKVAIACHVFIALQQTDLVALGQLILCLCCQSMVAVQPENFAKSIQHVSRNFSPDMLKIIQYVAS